MNSELLKNINEQVVEPTAHGLRKAKIDFYGFMYFGLMVKDNQPKVLEYNCRLGDPETQCLMLQLESDILEVHWMHFQIIWKIFHGAKKAQWVW